MPSNTKTAPIIIRARFMSEHLSTCPVNLGSLALRSDQTHPYALWALGESFGKGEEITNGLRRQQQRLSWQPWRLSRPYGAFGSWAAWRGPRPSAPAASYSEQKALGHDCQNQRRWAPEPTP